MWTPIARELKVSWKEAEAFFLQKDVLLDIETSRQESMDKSTAGLPAAGLRSPQPP
jgi:hypothetical protein